MENEELLTLRLKRDEGTLTYRVVTKTAEEYHLNHPLAPNMLLICVKSSVDDIQTAGKGDCQKLLEYGKKYSKYLDFNTVSELDAICYYFVMNRNLTSTQKRSLSIICGKIASYTLNGHLQAAMKIVNDNKGLLDYFNMIWYEKFAEHFEGKKVIDTRAKRDAIFNMAGFVLSQLEETRMEFKN